MSHRSSFVSQRLGPISSSIICTDSSITRSATPSFPCGAVAEGCHARTTKSGATMQCIGGQGTSGGTFQRLVYCYCTSTVFLRVWWQSFNRLRCSTTWVTGAGRATPKGRVDNRWVHSTSRQSVEHKHNRGKMSLRQATAPDASDSARSEIDALAWITSKVPLTTRGH